MTSTRARAVRWTLLTITALAAISAAGSRARADAAPPAPPAAATTPKPAGHDWNDEGIKWLAYDKGIAEAKAQKKPVCLVFFTEWCPHCGKYSAVFHDARVAEKSKQFVMIRLDKDKNKEISAQYKPDGEYIPRTYFLTKDAQLDADLHAPRPSYLYFYDESNPDGILGGMDAALKKFASGAAPSATPTPAAPAGGTDAAPAKGEAGKTP